MNLPWNSAKRGLLMQQRTAREHEYYQLSLAQQRNRSELTPKCRLNCEQLRMRHGGFRQRLAELEVCFASLVKRANGIVDARCGPLTRTASDNHNPVPQNEHCADICNWQMSFNCVSSDNGCLGMQQQSKTLCCAPNGEEYEWSTFANPSYMLG